MLDASSRLRSCNASCSIFLAAALLSRGDVARRASHSWCWGGAGRLIGSSGSGGSSRLDRSESQSHHRRRADGCLLGQSFLVVADPRSAGEPRWRRIASRESKPAGGRGEAPHRIETENGESVDWKSMTDGCDRSLHSMKDDAGTLPTSHSNENETRPRRRRAPSDVDRVLREGRHRQHHLRLPTERALGSTRGSSRRETIDRTRWRERSRGWSELGQDCNFSCLLLLLRRPSSASLLLAQFLHRRALHPLPDAIRYARHSLDSRRWTSEMPMGEGGQLGRGWRFTTKQRRVQEGQLTREGERNKRTSAREIPSLCVQLRDAISDRALRRPTDMDESHQVRSAFEQDCQQRFDLRHPRTRGRRDAKLVRGGGRRC